MLEIEVTTTCKPQHLFVVRIESVLEQPKANDEIVCGVCHRKTKIRAVGVPGRIRENKPDAAGQKSLFEE